MNRLVVLLAVLFCLLTPAKVYAEDKPTVATTFTVTVNVTYCQDWIVMEICKSGKSELTPMPSKQTEDKESWLDWINPFN